MKPEMKKLIIANLPYLLFVYLFGKLGQTYRLAAGADLSEKLLHLADGFSLAFESAAPSFHLFDLAVGVAGAVALRLMVYCKSKNAKKYRRGVEYGSARWGGPKDIAPYIDPVFDNNILLTQTERLTMNNRPKDPKTARNKNVLVIGGSGSGKTRFFVKPNLMQCVSKDHPTSFVITDPKGSLIGEVGQLLVRCGYRVKVLNTINFSKSMRYNPFRYIHSEKDILKLVNTLICNTKGEGEKSAEDFWIKSERLLYSALIGYIANTEHGVFTDYGYLVKSGDEWQRVHEGQPVPEEYRVMAYPAPEAPAIEQADRPDSRTREVQAESVAYAVCQHYGLDTSDYSFGYVAGWSSGKDLKELKASLETIRATAHELITTIDGHLARLQQQRQTQQEQPQAAEQPDPDSVFSKLSPKQQQEMTASVKAMLQTLIEVDLKSTGEVSQGTKEAAQAKGFSIAGDGWNRPKPRRRPPTVWKAAITCISRHRKAATITRCTTPTIRNWTEASLTIPT